MAAEYNSGDPCDGTPGAWHQKNAADGVSFLVCYDDPTTDYFTEALDFTDYGLMRLPQIDGVPCDPSLAGAFNYTSAVDPIVQYCDGTTWVQWGSTPTITGDPPAYSGPGGSAAGVQGEIQFNVDGTLLGGISQMYWDSANLRLGFNTTTPSTILHIGTASGLWADGGISFGTGNTGLYESASNVIAFRANGSNRAYVSSTGLGINGTPSTRLHVNAGSGDFTGGGLSFGATADTGIYESADDILTLRSEATDIVFVSSGGVGIGKSPVVALDVNGDINYSGVLVDTSDRRTKENIEPLAGSLEKVGQLKPVTFNRIGEDSGEVYFGLIAQEVQEIYPDMVHVKSEDGLLGVNYIGFIAPLIHSVQELKAENAALRERIEALESKNAE